MDARIVCVDEDAGLAFVWHGGAYVDVGPAEGIGEYGSEGWRAEDVINVWDDESDRSVFEVVFDGEPRTRRPFCELLELFEECCTKAVALALADEVDV